MVERITVSPERVRGAGNIVSPKTDSDFDGYNSLLSTRDDEVSGKIYTISYNGG